MKKKLYLLAAFMALNVAAQSTLETPGEIALNPIASAHTRPHKDVLKKASISLHMDAKKETLKVRSTLPVNELSINNLYGKKLIRKTNSTKIKLSSLTRGVYELEVRLEGTIFRRRIILE
ncbi:MAG: hypothetical protein QNJ57_04950 [Flavobacteriaceae bacterium]|nr:hypothetical protein [Flavobacteriaceae bacterium]